MKEIGKPVSKTLQHMTELVREMTGNPAPVNGLDLYDTEIAFASRSDAALKKMARLFGLMNNHWLVGIGSTLGLAAIRMHLPFVEGAVKNTIFEQFCGGTTLLETQKTIDRLYASKVVSVLDYGAEAKETEEDFNQTMNETLRAIDFASQVEGVPMVSIKVSGMARFELLEMLQQEDPLTPELEEEFRNVLKRVEAICHSAADSGMSVLIDAEESWIQKPIDDLADRMMRQYNGARAVVYNTFQMYRTDRLQFLMDSYEKARQEGYILGAKLVRGAYMDKERKRADELGYPSPIHPNKEATDQAYNSALVFCVEHYEQIASCNASHNAESVMLLANLMTARNIPRDHPHLMFCQLYGMSDNLTFNLAKAGFNTGKYVVYGAVREVVPYLIRRAQENSSVTGDMSRESQLVFAELKRRGLA